MKRQVSPMAMGEMNTGMMMRVRSRPAPFILRSSSTARKKPSTIWIETTVTDHITVNSMLFQKRRSSNRSL